MDKRSDAQFTSNHQSRTNWKIVRPPGLTDKEEVVPLIDARGKWSFFMTVTIKSLAQYLVQTLERSKDRSADSHDHRGQEQRRGIATAKRFT